MQDKIQEMMTLIDGYAASDSNNIRMLIESKLRELVREPLPTQYPENYRNPFACIAYDTGWRASYRSHNITSAGGDV